jgi:glycosyltransferase involved in cell wall biosynthesis
VPRLQGSRRQWIREVYAPAGELRPGVGETAARRPVSVIVLTRDEERCVRRCLDSVVSRGFDRVLVVDTGSRDGTLDIVRQYGAQGVSLCETAWSGSFAAARNRALELVPNGWVVFVDADEWLADGEPERLLKCLESLDGYANSDRYTFAPRIVEAHSKVCVEDVPRIFLRDSGIRYVGRVHEYPVLGPRKNETPGLAGVDITFLHDGYSPAVVQAKEKPARNLELLAQERQEDPENPRWLFFELREGLFQWDAPTLDDLCDSLREAVDKSLREAVDKSLREAVDGKGGSHDRTGRYYRQGLVYACQRLAMLGEWQRLRRNCDALDAFEGSVGPDSHYYRMSLSLIEDAIGRGDLLHTIKLRRDEEWVARGGLDGTGRQTDALIAAMLTKLGEHEKAERYREASEPWSDAFFDRSVLRAPQRVAA